ncbi:VWA domain-containing protein [Streptomyces echinoruber]|nr:VWA domain-containing protein [Streptomyces echinoruber]
MGLLTRLRNAFGRSRKRRATEADSVAPEPQHIPAQETAPVQETVPEPTPTEPASTEPAPVAEVRKPAPVTEERTPRAPSAGEEHELVAAAFDKVAVSKPTRPSTPEPEPETEAKPEPAPETKEPAPETKPSVEAAPAEEAKAEEPKVEEPEPEQPTAEEPKPEQPTAEEPTAEQPTAEEPEAQEPTAEEPKAEEPKAEEPKTEQPTAEEPAAQEPTAEQPKPEEPTVEEPKTEEPTAKESAAEEPKPVEEPKPEEPAAEEPTAEEPTAEQPPSDESKPEDEESSPRPESSAPASARTQTPAVTLARVKNRAPGLATAYRAAGAALKKYGLTGARATVHLVLDRSASMRPYYKDGSAQALGEQALALAAHLDPEAKVHVTFFSTEVDGTGELTLADHENKIDELHASLGRMGRTSYHAAVAAVLDEQRRTAPGSPALVIFQTDGAPDAKTPATQALTDAAREHPEVFFSFVAFGEHDNKAFDYLRKLKTDNASFFHAGPTPRELTDKEVYEGVLAAWRPAGA